MAKPDKGDWFHLVPDDVVLRRLQTRAQMRCVCCGTWYPRGAFRCCAPKQGMASHVWLAMSCPNPPRGCGRCVRHCECPNKTERLGAGPLAAVAREFMHDPAAFIVKADRIPGEEG